MDRRDAERRIGRPRRAEAPSSKRREFCLTEAEDAALQRIAAVAGVQIASLIREAVNEYVADYGERPVFRRVCAGKNSEDALPLVVNAD